MKDSSKLNNSFAFAEKFFGIGHERTIKAKKNIVGLFGIKGLNIIIGFVMVPLTLNYLDPTRYGIWLTISALFNWFVVMNIGLGNGLRNRLAESIARKDIIKARIYVSTTYAALILIFSVLFFLFFIANYFIDWTVILNTPSNLQGELSTLAGIVFLFFCIRFVIELINSIAFALQEPLLVEIINVVGKVLSLVSIFLLTKYTDGSLIYLGVALTGIPVFTGLILSVAIFKTRYQFVSPSIYLVRFSELKYILSLGIKFFITRIATIVFYQTNAIIIAQLFGPKEVTPFSIAYQYFNIVTTGFLIILTPIWSAITDAYVKKDFSWIRNTIKKLNYIFLGMVGVVIILYLLSTILIKLWVGNQITVPQNLLIVIAIFTIINNYNAIKNQVLNGTGKILFQVYRVSIMTILYIPLTIFFSKQYGLVGIMFSQILFGIISTGLYEIQYKKIVTGTAKGIWNK